MTKSELEKILAELDEADGAGGADAATRNELENVLVNIGKSALPQLVDQLQVVRGVKRGVVAMTLIRIGGPSVEYLKKAAKANKDFEWVAQYLIREIEGLAA